jgi:hypothetical protein
MEDLIKEEEFISGEYNPWPFFKKFFFIIPIYGFVRLVLNSFTSGDIKVLINAIYTILPVIVACAMIFSRKRNILLPIPIIFKALIYLMGVVYISYLVLNLLEALNYGIDPLFYMSRTAFGFAYPFVHFIFCIIIILPIRALLKKVFA